MSRDDLANAVFEFFKRTNVCIVKDADIWRSIAQTDDVSLLTFYEDKILKGGELDG